jgi:hypothetical protein
MSAVSIRLNAHLDRDRADRDLDAGVSIVIAGLEASYGSKTVSFTTRPARS